MVYIVFFSFPLSAILHLASLEQTQTPFILVLCPRSFPLFGLLLLWFSLSFLIFSFCCFGVFSLTHGQETRVQVPKLAQEDIASSLVIIPDNLCISGLPKVCESRVWLSPLLTPRLFQEVWVGHPHLVICSVSFFPKVECTYKCTLFYHPHLWGLWGQQHRRH